MITKRGQTGRHRCPAASVVEHTNMNKLRNGVGNPSVLHLTTFSDMKVWALRIIAGIALIVIGTICLPKIWLKNSFSEISTARKRNPRRGKMQGRVKVWKTCAPFLATHIKTEKGAIYWKKIQMLIIVRQMKDTTRVDQRPRKWSVNPQHKLETRFSHNYEI